MAFYGKKPAVSLPPHPQLIIFDVRCSDKVEEAIELLCPCGKRHWAHLSVMWVTVSGYFQAETKHD